MVKWISIILFLLINTKFVIGQHTVHGQVLNSKNEALPYASVYLLKNKLFAVSKTDGSFEIKTPSLKGLSLLDTLCVRYVGYETQKIPLSFNSNNDAPFKVIMRIKNTELNPVEIINSAKYSPAEIVLNALSEVKNNYATRTMFTEGFYREKISENGKWIAINEAVINLKYAKYSQNNFVKKQARKYWNKEYTRQNVYWQSDIFIHLINYPYYVSPQDELEIISSRKSLNQSQFGLNASPVGGPFDLIAMDKIKYGSDFLDKDLMEQYTYNLVGLDKLNGEDCYVVQFYPNAAKKRKGVISLLEKFKYAIYSGRLYISKESFALYKIEAQFASGTHLKSLSGSGAPVTKYLQYTVNYAKTNNTMCLQSVETEQRNLISVGSEIVDYVCFRSLNFINPTPYIAKQHKNHFKKKLPRLLSIRNYNVHYDTSFWENYSKSDRYIPLETEILQELEKESPLEAQFHLVNSPIEKLPIPRAKKRQISKENLYEKVLDNYAWMEDMSSTDLLDYLKQENVYYGQVLEKLNPDKKKFYYSYLNFSNKEITQNKASNSFDSSAFKWKTDEKGNNILYKGKQVILDYNEASKGYINFHLESWQTNSHKHIAYSYNKKGEISNTLVIKPFDSNQPIDRILNINDFVWLNDTIILYTKLSPTLRSSELIKHNITNSLIKDIVIYEEKDVTFDLSIQMSKSGELLLLKAQSLLESQYFNVITDSLSMLSIDPLTPRNSEVNYYLDHYFGSSIYTVKSSGNEPAEIIRLELDLNGKITSKKRAFDILLPVIDLIETKNYLAISFYQKNRIRMGIFNKETAHLNILKLSEENVDITMVSSSYHADSCMIDIAYIEKPTEQISIHLKQHEIYDSTLVIDREFELETNLIWAKSEDGEKIPITVLGRKDLSKKQYKGIIVKAYGAYGAFQTLSYSTENMVYAQDSILIAFVHTRGGGERGNFWYNSGRQLNKKNSFTDYIDGVKHLQSEYGFKPKQTIGYGTSAGGLIMGYAANNAPNLFGGIIFNKPYLDVLETMINPALPLTTMEYKEWGNPEDSLTYAYIKSYSVYQNITKANYPVMLFNLKYNDNQTVAWQIAKSVAKFRSNNLSKNLILLHSDFNSGHYGSTNYDKQVAELADKYSFISHVLNKEN